MTALRIRAATKADVPSIARIHVQAWFESYRGMVPDDMLAALSVERNASLWDAILDLEDDETVVQVVEEDGGIVGFGSACKARSEALGTSGEVTSIYLIDAVKRRGIGRTLFVSLMRALARRGHKSVGLWVLIANAPTRRFYEVLGGRAGAERTRERDHGDLHEIAYVWDDLKRFGAAG